MNILVFGGGRFVGKHMVHTALQHGHQVSCITRSGNVPSGAHAIILDRNEDLSVLKDTVWDAVIDVSGYFPEQIAKAARVLAADVHYVFISTISVYKNLTPPIEEHSELQAWTLAHNNAVTGENYGGLKVQCEEKVQQYWHRNTILRPHVVIGADDYTQRFHYWVSRALQGGRAVAPDTLHMQCVAARDLADFTLHCLQDGILGTYNVARDPESWQNVLHTIAETTGSGVQWQFIAETLLLQHAQAWTDLPLWLPSTAPEYGLHQVNNQKARDKGLKDTALQDVIAEIMADVQSKPFSGNTLTPEKEQGILQLLGTK